jgi:integrase
MKVPKLSRHKGTNSACIKYQGKRHYFGKWDSEESRQRYGRFVRSLLDGNPNPLAAERTPGLPLVCDLVDQFLEHARAVYSGGEYYSLKSAAAALMDTHSTTTLEQFGPRALVDVQQNMIGRGWKRGHVNHQIQRVRRIFRWGVSRELLPGAKIYELESISPIKPGQGAVDSDPVEPVDDHIVRATLPHLSPLVATMVRVQRVAGMRPGEICAMQRGSLDLSGDIWLYQPDQHKNAWRGAKRVIALPPSVQPLLAPLIQACGHNAQAYLFSPRQAMAELRERRRANRKTKMSPSHRARTPRIAEAIRDHYDTNSYRQAIDYGIEASARDGVQLPPWNPGQLRHTAADEATELLGMRAAQRLLGHAQLATTEYYLSQQVSDLVEVARQLDARRLTGPPGTATAPGPGDPTG